MGRTNDLYMMMRLAYEQAVDDYNNKKTDSILRSYKKYHIINVGMGSSNAQRELMNFYNEDNSLDSII
tara:strand:- start:101 stop:304 length:204 start_codon:yes stop_codon:yes gene_type:complete